MLALNLSDSTGLTTFLRLQPKATHVPIVVIVDERRRGPRGGRGRARRARFADVDQLQPRPGGQGAALRDRAHAHAARAQGVRAALSRAVPERHGRRVPDDARRQVHGGESGAGAHAGLRLARTSCSSSTSRATSTWTRARARTGRDDDARRRGAQRRDGAEAQGRLEDRRARELARGARRRRPRAVLRGHADRHHGGARAVAAALVRCEPRRADGPVEPARVRAAAAAGARADAGHRRDARHALTSTSTASRRSTTRAATSRATSCCARLGQRLQQRVRGDDVVARLGGDEFAVLLHNCAPEDAMQVANNLLQAMSASSSSSGAHTSSLSASASASSRSTRSSGASRRS